MLIFARNMLDNMNKFSGLVMKPTGAFGPTKRVCSREEAYSMVQTQTRMKVLGESASISASNLLAE